VDRALGGNIGEPVDLIGGQISFEADLAFYDIYSGIGFTLTILAVSGVHLVSAQAEFDAFHWPVFSPGIHLNGHDGTGSQGAKQQTVRIRTCVITDTERFVGDEFMATGPYSNLDVGGALRGYYHNIISFSIRMNIIEWRLLFRLRSSSKPEPEPFHVNVDYLTAKASYDAIDARVDDVGVWLG
jgi:hypothetical protein